MRTGAIPGVKRSEFGRRARACLEALFLLLTGVYLLYSFGQITTFVPGIPIRFEKWLLLAMGGAAVARLAFIGPFRWKTLAGIAIAGVYGMSYRAGRYRFLLYLAVLTVGLIDVDYRRVLRVYLAAVGGLLAATVIAALAGSIANIVHFRDDSVRSSWGVAYPTDFSSIFLFVLLALWAAWRKLPDWGMLLLSLTSVLLALLVTRSRNCLLSSVLFSCVVGWRWLESALAEKRCGRAIQRACDALVALAFPLCAAAAFGMVYLYSRDTALGLRLNEMLSDRLRLCLEGFRAHGITPFGAAFEQIGYGFSPFPPLDYNFIDSSYVLILLRYGWVTLAMLAVLWGVTALRAARSGNRRLALVMAVIAFHSIVEHHFTEAHFNVMLVLPLTALPAFRPEPARPRREDLAAGGAAALLCAALCWLLPRLITWLRTLFGALGWRGEGRTVFPAGLISLAVAALLGVVIWTLCGMARDIAGRRKPRAARYVALAVCAALGAGGFALGSAALDRTAAGQAALLEADAPAMEAILGAATGRVYADELPVLYQRRFGGVSPTVLPGEDLARKAGATVLADAGEERRAFLQRGFRYAQISDAHCVYTADPGAIGALEAAGFTVADYYYTPMPVDLAAEAELNGLPIDDGGMRLSGPDHSLIYGPYRDLNEGSYAVEYRLALPEDASAEEGVVCTLRVHAYWGRNVVAELPVYRSQFGESGELTIDLPFATSYARALEYLVFAGEGRDVLVRGISCRRVAG